MNARPALERAIAALRAGRPVRLGTYGLLAVETATDSMLDLFDPDGSACLLISGARGAALNLCNQLEAADGDAPVMIARPDWLDQATAMELVDPAHDGERGPIGPLEAVHPPDNASASLRLARYAGLLPALWIVPAGSEVGISLNPDELVAGPVATIVARARLPLEGLPPSQMVSFRDPASGEDHVALIVGAFGGKPPLVRLHSECLTGDVFGSLKCDCGPQLNAALAQIGAEGAGVLLYLNQEGRGIGLANKMRAYALQDQGFDTVEANHRLGFEDDERDFRIGADILRALGFSRVRLMTNNPKKVAMMDACGLSVVERVPLKVGRTAFNDAYLRTKAAKSGHLL